MHANETLITPTPSAYSYPLLVKQLLLNSLSLYGDQEIVYRGEHEQRYRFRDFHQRIGRLANALSSLGVGHRRQRPERSRPFDDPRAGEPHQPLCGA